jgi:hypothetical protein
MVLPDEAAHVRSQAVDPGALLHAHLAFVEGPRGRRGHSALSSAAVWVACMGMKCGMASTARIQR